MKKSLYAILVILLSSIGANALAAKLDINVKRVVSETKDLSGGANGSGDGGSGRNSVTREK